MTTCSYSIAGGDYDHAGSASRSLKELLKSVGVAPEAVRRVMVAAYEAEMNVIIHAFRGTLQATVDAAEVRVSVIDEGPGIADLQLAMKEGYSTAPPKARELGFGAGLGLPNIKKHSDSFRLLSELGQGTRVHFSVKFEPRPETADRSLNSLHLHGDLCRQCLQCVHGCPTQALRVHRGVPNLLTHLCLECTACQGLCPAGALGLESPSPLPTPSSELVVPPAFLFQFGALVAPGQVFLALEKLGYGRILLLEDWEQARWSAVQAWVREQQRSTPVLSSSCPAVLNLIETRFPALLQDVAPFVTPEHAAAQDLGGSSQLVVLCPSQRTSLLLQGVEEQRLLDPLKLREALIPLLQHSTTAGERAAASSPKLVPPDPGIVRVEGIREVLQTLEELEDGLLAGLSILDLVACPHGCFGSGLLRGTNAALAAHRWAFEHRTPHPAAQAWKRERPLIARPGLRLDPDMAEALSKLSRLGELLNALPGRDCGQCGAPSCRAFAEDVILDRASRRGCVHASWNKGKTT